MMCILSKIFNAMLRTRRQPFSTVEMREAIQHRLYNGPCCSSDGPLLFANILCCGCGSIELKISSTDREFFDVHVHGLK